MGSSAPPRASRGLVLVIEPDPDVRAQAVLAVRSAGFDARDVDTLAAARGLDPDLSFAAAVVTDRLPDGTAADLLLERRLPTIVLASTPRSDLATRAVLAGARAAVARGQVGAMLGDALRLAIAPRSPVRAGRRAATPEPQEVPHPDDPSAALPRTSPAGKVSAAQRELISALRGELTFLRRVSLYRVLQVPDDASEPDIIVAFGQFAAKWHPDRMAPEASPEMRAIAGEVYELGRSAYDLLVDPVKRARYVPPVGSYPPRTAPRIAAGPADVVPPPAPQSTEEAIARIVDALDATETTQDGSGAIQIDLFEEDAQLGHARVLVQKGDHAAARRVLAEILSEDEASAPALALVHVLAALEADKSGLQVEAADEVARALDLDPACAEALLLKKEREEERSAERHSLLARVLGKSPPS